ncbi:MAG: radical SAM protein [Microgenomates group bacterium]|jgi:tRNA-2-methylthio-N6-dimethylallyladenosine synthase|nr:radical SAM protein [Candidatus Woesebacteria bacterium]MBP6882841.1 radical SAM protein [Candidatus Woesebacteria bacterium]QQR63580.1 MAG: radical SAM protein [Candidatus Roizmanbacteria bacterium]
MKYFLKTFGCQQNHADSERLRKSFDARGIIESGSYEEANYVIINTCMVRESAENRVYGLVNNLGEIKKEKIAKNEFYKIIITGCMVGLAFRDKTGKFLDKIRNAMPAADEFMPIEEVGFDLEPVRNNATHAWVPISNGCNNFCTFCVVPFTRGREISRPFHSVLEECENLKKKGYTSVTLLGQNVNSYGSDLLIGEENVQTQRDLEKTYFSDKTELTNPRVKIEFKLHGKKIEPIYVKHLGRFRIPTLFPYLLEAVAQLGFEKVDFYSANPWDYSDELIDVIARNTNITRDLHIPVQSGDTEVLKRMNRWYSHDDYLNLISKLKSKIPEMKISTDIIVGFPGETDAEFENTVKLAKEVGFYKAYLAMYSQRPMTSATKLMEDSVPHPVKKQRWQILEDLINKPHLS